MKWSIAITILDKANEEKLAKQLGIGNRKRYRDSKGRLVFFKRIDPSEYPRYRIEGVRVD